MLKPMPTTYLQLPPCSDFSELKETRQKLEEPNIVPPCELNLP
jgi:hypothetical protein